MRKIAFAGIFGLGLLTSSALAQDAAVFSSEGWTGHKRANDPDNGCIMGKHVTKDVYFVVYANANEGFNIGVSVSSWNLQIGDEWSGSVTFDDHEPILLIGSVVEPEIVLFPGGGEEDGLEPLMRSARQIRLSYGHSKFGLSLKGSSKALDLLSDCAENREEQSQSAPISARYLYIGSKMPMPRIVEASGIGTAKAYLKARMGKAELKEWCDNWQPESTLDDCLTVSEMKPILNQLYEVSANCETGELTDDGGNKLIFDGIETKDATWRGMYRFKDIANGKRIELGNAAGGDIPMAQWKSLCPAGLPLHFVYE